MSDFETLRQVRLAQINAHPGTRQELEALHGLVWDPGELVQCFEVEGFLAPFVVVRRPRRWHGGLIGVPVQPPLLFSVSTGRLMASLCGALLVAGLIGGMAGSWTIFLIVFAALWVAAVHAGDIRQ